MITKQYTYNGVYYDDFEGENYQKIVNILQTEDLPVLSLQNIDDLLVILDDRREEESRVHPRICICVCYRDFSDKSSTTRLRFALNDNS